MAVAIRIKRGTKANIESAKATLKQWEQVYATDTDEIGIYDGTNIRWQSGDYELTKSKIDTALKGTGTNSIQLGSGASTLGYYSTALGTSAIASGLSSTALGSGAEASGDYSTALGTNSSASEDYSTVLGNDASASGASSTALGVGAHAEGLNSTALGVGAHAKGLNSTAIGHYAQAEGVNSIAIGIETVVTEDNVVDFGSARQVRVNETPVDDRDAVSKVYLESVISASGGEVDLNEMSYFDYAGRIYGAKYNLLANAWEHSLTVDPLEISEDGAFSNYRGTAQYPNGEIEGVIIPHSVTSIGEYAFNDWTSNNQPLVIPNSVTSIGSYAFGYWQENNQPLVIPNSVTSIGSRAFCVWQKNKHPLVIPESVTSIGINAFVFWVLVPYIEIQAITPPTLANANAFSNQSNAPIYVPDESVDDYKTATQWVKLADRIFPISDKGEIDLNEMSYFDYAGSIYGAKYSLLANAWERSLAVDPSGISEDSDMSSPRGTAQYPNGETEGVIIPHSVTSIGNSAFFAWSSNNQPLVIPNSVTSIGEDAFMDWEANNQPLTIPSSVTSIGSYAFSDWTSNNQPLVIPNSVTSIGDLAFSNWSSNNQPLVIPDSITSIEDYVFLDWEANNQPLVIPNSVTSIGEGAFNNWASNNQPLVIPNSVTEIGASAFENWTSAKEFIMESETPPTITSNSFNNTNNAPFYVPDDSVDDYKKATNWVNLASRIFPISDKGNTYTKGEIDLMIGDIENALDAILGV